VAIFRISAELSPVVGGLRSTVVGWGLGGDRMEYRSDHASVELGSVACRLRATSHDASMRDALQAAAHRADESGVRSELVGRHTSSDRVGVSDRRNEPTNTSPSEYGLRCEHLAAAVGVIPVAITASSKCPARPAAHVQGRWVDVDVENSMWSERRARNAPSISSKPAQIRWTAAVDPESTPRQRRRHHETTPGRRFHEQWTPPMTSTDTSGTLPGERNAGLQRLAQIVSPRRPPPLRWYMCPLFKRVLQDLRKPA
jgi:hypothetical protein